MGEVVGFVTRTRSRANEALFGVTSGVPPLSRMEAVASRADGTIVGEFASIGSAQRAVERSLGGQLLSWFREDLNGDIEHWRGELRQFWPGDLNPGAGQGPTFTQQGLLQGGVWVRADKLTELVPAAAPPSTEQNIARWKSIDGAGTTRLTAASAATTPGFADGDETTTGRPAARFDGAQSLPSNLTLSPPYSVHVIASFADLAADRASAVAIGALENFSLNVTAADLPELVVDSTAITAAAISAGDTVILSAVHHAADVDFYVNGTFVGTVVAVASSGAVTVSLAGDPWQGDIFEVILAPNELNDNVNAKIIRYALDRYNIVT